MSKELKTQTNERMFIDIPLLKLECNKGQIEGLPANPRQITEAKLDRLKQNIRDYPEMLDLRGLLVYPLGDKYVIIGGNMRFVAMKSLGMETAPCIVIPQETTVEKLKAYTILDNNGFGKWDWDMLANEWDEMDLDNWGLDFESWNPEDESDGGDNDGGGSSDEESPYTQKIGKIVYEPSGLKPALSELVDKSYTSKLLERIDAANIPEDIKSFLRDAAYRHNRFDYEKIANYYAQSDKEIQELMEDSALVIIDFDKAVELGFVRLTQNFDNEFRKSYGDNVPEDYEEEDDS